MAVGIVWKVFFPERERGGIRSIYGMTGAESITVLKQAIAVLTNSDQELTAEEQAEYERQGATGYWMPTNIWLVGICANAP